MAIAFTTEIKNKWIQLLESGEFRKGKGQLFKMDEDGKGCRVSALGVLAYVLKDEELGRKVIELKNHYIFYSYLGEEVTELIVNANDSYETYHGDVKNETFAMTIDLIKSLKALD